MLIERPRDPVLDKQITHLRGAVFAHEIAGPLQIVARPLHVQAAGSDGLDQLAQPLVVRHL
jgi:hypothetical protein